MPKTIKKGSIPTVPQQYQFVQSSELEKRFKFGKHQRLSLRDRLPQGIYWIQPDRAILWNLRLVTDYLVNGNRTDTPQHQRLVEEYLATLPSHQSA